MNHNIPAWHDAGPAKAHPQPWLGRATQGLWFVILVTSPIYLFASGLPQPADLLAMLLIIATAVLGFRVPAYARMIVIAAGTFVWYASVVNVTWALRLGEASMLRPPIFYLFNFLVLLSCVTLYESFGDKFLRLTTHGIIWSLFLLLLTTPVTFEYSSTRQVLLFNNPNQLGYYGLLSATVVALSRERFRLTGWYWAAAISTAILLIVLSLSKAAILGGVILLFLVFRRKPLALAGVAGITAVVAVLLLKSSSILTMLIGRLSDIGAAADDNFAGRGYDRIWNHLEYLFLGAGEGEYQRFTSVLDAELHSSWATILFCYGLVGLLLFGLFLWAVFKASEFRHFVFFLPTLFYGLTHQGLRTTGLWVLFAFSLLIAVSCKRDAPASSAALL